MTEVEQYRQNAEKFVSEKSEFSDVLKPFFASCNLLTTKTIAGPVTRVRPSCMFCFVK